MAAIDPAIYEDMEISAETTTGTPKTIDLKLGVVSFNYYEDLFSPCLTAQLLIVSSGGATQTVVEEVKLLRMLKTFIVDYQYVVERELKLK